MKRAENLSFPHLASYEENSSGLSRLADEVSDIAQKISRIGKHARLENPSFQVDESFVRRMLLARRGRSHFFSDGLFADPAWDMLLDLLAAKLANERVSVSSLCIAANVPPTTALRWIKILELDGLVERCPDVLDGRRVFIKLTEKAAHCLDTYFSSFGYHLML